MSNEEIQEAVARAEAEYEMLKDKVHDQYDEIQKLKQENEKYKRYVDDTFLYTYEELQDKVLKLQKENRELNKMCEIYSKSLYNADLTKAEKRIDKAIEYIKKHSNNCMFELRIEEMEDLLNILVGDK